MLPIAAMCAVLLGAAPVSAQGASGDASSLPVAQALRLLPPLILGAAEAKMEAPAAAPSLDFDLLGAPAQPAQPPVDEGALATRRSMLKVHQGLGIGLMALELSTLVLGQLNYRDRFGGGDRSGRFTRAHAALAYTTFGLFVTNELIAFLAPSPLRKESQGFDRATLHRVAMMTAAAGMLASVVMGIVTSERAGYENQRDLAKAHLFIGYGTYAAMAVGVSAFIF
ncbi:MAG: hypothetical protein HY901_10325 [Deltaproteobacteria bacterium]|nr:hypothetical protein [Deltaproteobacteria bacterium]